MLEMPFVLVVHLVDPSVALHHALKVHLAGRVTTVLCVPNCQNRVLCHRLQKEGVVADLAYHSQHLMQFQNFEIPAGQTRGADLEGLAKDPFVSSRLIPEHRHDLWLQFSSY